MDHTTLLSVIASIAYLGIVLWKWNESRKQKRIVNDSLDTGMSRFHPGNRVRGKAMVLLALLILVTLMTLSVLEWS